jgi:hypothetical protein
LVRRNTLRTIASHHLAVARGLHVTSEVVQHDINSVEIPADDVVSALRRKTARVGAFRERLANRPHTLEVTYEDIMHEDLIDDALIRRLCEFFDVDDKFMRRPRTLKMAPEQLRALITNYDEVAAAVSKTEFQKFLD